MKNYFGNDIKTSLHGELSIRDFTNSVSAQDGLRYLALACKRLRVWMIECLIAHEDRVASLRVYRQYRVDIHKTRDVKNDYCG